MGWTAVIQNMDWSAVGFINEFDAALSERMSAASGGSRANTAVGVDVQAASFWNTIQSWIVNNADEFVQSHSTADGSALGNEYYNHKATIDMWTFSNLMISTSLGEAAGGEEHFRRSSTEPLDWTDWDDLTFSYGLMQVGDIIGPWIFKDLQDAFNRLLWTVGTLAWTDTTLYEGADVGGSGTWAATKAAADADWGAGGVVGSLRPRVFSRGRRDGGTYEGYLRHLRAKPQVTKPSTIAAALDWYLYGDANPLFQTWDDHDDQDKNAAVITEEEFNLMYSDVGSTASGTVTGSTLIGSTATATKPGWLAEPPNDNTNYYLGWHDEFDASRCIMRWTGFAFP